MRCAVRRLLVLVGIVGVIFSLPLAAQENAPPVFTDAQPDAPEWAQRGSYPVGVRTLTVTNSAGSFVRELLVEVWYPADAADDALTRYVDSTVAPDYTFLSRAQRDAPLLDPTAPFPLIVISHGLIGTRLQLTYLGDHLASHGFVVAAVDHADPANLITAYSQALRYRPSDIQAVIAGLVDRPRSVFSQIIDHARIGLIGYSFGGYGALVNAGAGITAVLAANPLLDDAVAHYVAGTFVVDPRVRAVMLLAPYGMDVPPPITPFWDADGLAAVTLPLFMVVGSADVVAGYETGAEVIFDAAVNSPRCLLTWVGAGHEAPINPRPASFARSGEWNPYFLNNVTQHFARAFFGVHLQDTPAFGRYLDLQMVDPLWSGFALGTNAGMGYRCANPPLSPAR